MLTILSIAYPLARVGPDAVGGAEQVLSMLDVAIEKAGHRSLVVACAGSKVAGELISIPAPCGPLDASSVEAARSRHRQAIESALRRWNIDLVHMHGVDFNAYLPAPGIPVLATLHCPAHWYAGDALAPARPATYLNAVSLHQHLSLPPNPRLLAPVANGVAIEALTGRYRRRGFAVVLSRIAPEKGVHLALDAAKAAAIPLLVAGELFAYPEHSHYFTHEVAPRLDRARRYIGPVGFAAKRRLLGMARCLLVCSQVAETSSLAAREAMAAGTPVVALRKGALPEVIEDGRTGFLVDDADGLPGALRCIDKLDPEACRRTARLRFDAARMTRQYLQMYEQRAQRAHSGLAISGAI